MRKVYCDFSVEKLQEAKKDILTPRPYVQNLNCRNCGDNLISWIPYRMGYCEKCWEKGYGKMPEIKEEFENGKNETEKYKLRKCENCGCEFALAYSGGDGKYCTKRCKDEANETEVEDKTETES